MPVYNRIAHFADDMTAWRRAIHANPELGMSEFATAALVADKLRAFGVDEVITGVGQLGVVGVIRAGTSSKAIGLRADMDALPIVEDSELEYRSNNHGVMHACGHDGHTTMLLGAARYLAETRNFDGTVYLIFQPAEEGRGGAEAMLADGLFERFPMATVHGMHNWPGLPAGEFAIRVGTMMAATDQFDVTVRGKGGHGAQPHKSVDPIFVTTQIVGALQAIVSRRIDPAEAAVLSVTQLRAGSAHNIIPETSWFQGTVRTTSHEARHQVHRLFHEIVPGIAASFGATVEIDYQLNIPPTVNEANAVALAREAAREVAGATALHDVESSCMAGEDFAFMLEKKPGSYMLIGNGTDGRHANGLHNSSYDFNDAILPAGASYWVKLTETALRKD